jgi:hypothetical protein
MQFVRNQTIQIIVSTEEMANTIQQLDKDGMPIVKIEDDRGGNSGAWVFTIGEGAHT